MHNPITGSRYSKGALKRFTSRAAGGTLAASKDWETPFISSKLYGFREPPNVTVAIPVRQQPQNA